MKEDFFEADNTADGEKENLFSFDSDFCIAEKRANDSPVFSSGQKVKIPLVELDRKAAAAKRRGIASVFLFLLFPLAISAVVGGAKAARAPSYGKKARAAVVLGIISLLLFLSAAVLCVVFYERIISYPYIRSAVNSVIDFINGYLIR